MLEIEKTTNKYYSRFLGTEEIIFNNKTNLFFNPGLDNILKGYSHPMNILILIKDATINISYGNKAKDIIPKLLETVQHNKSIDYIKNKLIKDLSLKVKHNLKYIFKDIVKIENKAVKLSEEHSELFLNFFKTNNLNCRDFLWVGEYFNELVKKDYIHGIIVDGILVSATDAPEMPYMSDSVQEIGINTLKEYRKKGYAQMSCISMIETLITKNICPMWSTENENIGSDRLANSIGFKKYCDLLTVIV
jgi:hypothetical protein